VRRHVLIPVTRLGTLAALVAAVVTVAPTSPAGGRVAVTITRAYQTGS
jgi:hypothetical protein